MSARPLTLVDARYQANNSRAPARLGQQVRYIARSGRVALFDRLLAPRTVAEARSLIAAHGLAPAWAGTVAYHRLVLSLRAGRGLDDVALARLLAAVALGDLGRILDRRPVWVAGIHTDTDNLHAHILVAGGDERGRAVEIRRGALAQFKQAIERRAHTLAG